MVLFPGYLSTDKTMNVKLRQVKSAIIGNLPNEQTGRMESARSYNYNRALRYWTLERCGIKTEGAETYHLCNQHEVERIMKPLYIQKTVVLGLRVMSLKFQNL